MSVIKKGIESAMVNSGKGGKFLTLQPDVPVDVVMAHGLDNVQSVDQHDWWDYNPAPHLVCLGDECPSCALGNESKVKSYIGIITKEQEVKYFPVGVSLLGQLQKAEKAVGDLTGRVVRFEKTGVGLKTKYSAIMLGKKLDVSKFVLPDLEELLGALTVDAQIAKLNEVGIDTSGIKPSARKAKTSKKAETPASEIVPATTEGVLPPWDITGDDTPAEGIEGWATL